jgi:CBS domain-containing protein
MEQSFFTDQDNAIIFENRSDEDLSQTSSYFVSLGNKVNEMLEVIGYRLCKGENMAGNPRWCQTIETWKKYFSNWIKTPGPEELLKVSIFFDFRFCFGDSFLYSELKNFVRADLKTNDIFFHHMAASLKPFNPSLSVVNDRKTDIKKILIPLTGIIRLYALKFGISEYSTVERTINLYSEEKFNYILSRESIKAWKDLTSLRLSHQANCINKGLEPDNMVDFRLVQSEAVCYAEQAVRTIRNLMLKTENDFYTGSV